MNREIWRKMLKQARKAREERGEELYEEDGTPKVRASDIIAPRKPVSRSEAIDRTTQELLAAMGTHVMPGTVLTLKDVLDKAEGEIIERAWRAGRPLPREQVRAAIQEIYRRGEMMRQEKKR
jgi:hypothetical protein